MDEKVQIIIFIILGISVLIALVIPLVNTSGQAKTAEALKLAKAAIKHGDKINIMADDGLFLNNCGNDPNAPCLDTKEGTAHYVSTYDKDPAGSQWTINKP